MEFLSELDPNAIVQGGALLLLAAVMVGGWKIAKPAVDNWMKQYSALLDYTLEMTKAMGEINANLQRSAYLRSLPILVPASLFRGAR